MANTNTFNPFTNNKLNKGNTVFYHNGMADKLKYQIIVLQSITIISQIKASLKFIINKGSNGAIVTNVITIELTPPCKYAFR